MAPSARYGSTSTASLQSSRTLTPTTPNPITDPPLRLLATVPAAAPGVVVVDMAALAANWRLLAARVGPKAACAAVVKADAYGLGMGAVSRTLAATGCHTFFVAVAGEALALRAVLPDAVIFCLNGVPAGTESEFIQHRIIPVLNHPAEIARWQGEAVRRERVLAAAVHLDTGMSRLGLTAPERRQLAQVPERLAGLELRAWISHLACAESRTHALNGAQLGRFHTALASLPPAPASLANSSGIFLGRAFHYALARPGAALFGVNPTPGAPNPMADVVQVWARILQVRSVDSGQTVGYGAHHRMVRAGRVALVAAGYADGWHRTLGGSGRVVVAGHLVPVIGPVSMDLLTVDVTDLPPEAVERAGWAGLITPQLPVDAVAADAGTIGYEILTGLSRRFHRLRLTGATETGSVTQAVSGPGIAGGPWIS